jgi:hypothetical protein
MHLASSRAMAPRRAAFLFMENHMRNDPDDALVALFKHHANHNEAKSIIAGRPIFDDVEVVEIRKPGSKDYSVHPATEFSHWDVDPITGSQVKVTYAERFQRQYQQFKAKAAQTKSGTPLEHAKFLTEGRRAELRAQNIYTVEALATIDGQELKNLGPGGRELKNAAMEYIEESKASVPSMAMQAELEALRAKNAVLQEDLEAAKASGEGEFRDMNLEQLREFITAHTGHAPIGTANRKTLVRMAMEARPEKVA